MVVLYRVLVGKDSLVSWKINEGIVYRRVDNVKRVQKGCGGIYQF